MKRRLAKRDILEAVMTRGRYYLGSVKESAEAWDDTDGHEK